MNTLFRQLNGSKTYIAVALLVLYAGVCAFVGAPMDDRVAAILVGASVAALRHSVKRKH